MTKTFTTAAVLFCLLLIQRVGAQPADQKAAAPADLLGRSTPHGTAVGLIAAAKQASLERAGEYLDSGSTPSERGDLAQKLAVVLNRGLFTSLDRLSHEATGDLGDGLTDRDRVGVVESPTGNVEIFLDRVERGQGNFVWLFSSSTLREIPRLYDEIQPPLIERYLPEWFTSTQWLSMPLYRWILFALFVPLIFGLAALSTRVLTVWLRPLIAKLSPERQYQTVASVGPLRLLVLSLLFYAGSFFGFSLATRHFWERVAQTLMVLALCWLSLRLMDIAGELSLQRLQRVNRSADIALVRLMSRLLKAAAVIVAILVLLYMSDVDLTAALTGLGVGGLAIGFGAQKTIENLFGGIMVISDKPVNVGDVCKVGDVVGTVEDIGIRSTRIRTADRTVVSVPNGQLAAMVLENFAPRDRTRFQHTIGVGRQTTPDTLRYVLAQIRTLVESHPRVDTASARTRLIRVSPTSLDLEIFAYVLESDQPAFLAIQEDLLLGIMDILDANGVAVAVPVPGAPPATVRAAGT